MKIIETETISEKTIFNPDLSSWVYNGLDCCVTHEIRDKLRSELSESPENVQQTYADSMSKLAPVMEMSLRGFRIDQKSLNTALGDMQSTLDLLQSNFDRLCEEGLETKCNWRSHVQVKNLFYGILGIKPIKDRNSNGVYAPSSNRKALEKLCNNYYAEPFARHILALRDLGKAIGFLKSEIDSDNRIRSTYNVAGTNTGRLSSSINEFGTGTNLQNVSSALRYPFIADEGMIQVNVDLEQADARNLAALIYVHAMAAGEDEEFYAKYLNACESGDLHTFVCRMAWSQLNWPEDQSGWRAVADQTAYREMSYRDLAKRLGHGCLTEDHEVLTPNGWVSIAEKPSTLMAWNPITEELSWEEPTHWEDKPWYGSMYEIFGAQYSMFATADHRMPVFTRGGLFKERPAESLHEVKDLDLKCIGRLTEGSGGDVTPEQARLVSAAMADAHIYENGSVRWGFSKTRKKERLEKLLGSRKYKVIEYQKRNETYYHLPADEVDFPLLKEAGPEMLSWGSESLAAWVDELPYWDGTQQETFTWIYGKSRKHMKWVHTFCMLVGQSASYCENKGHDCARVGLNNRKNRRIGSLRITEKDGNGVQVYCPTVPSSGFLVRRKGVIMFSLNTNYYGKPVTMAKHTQTDKTIIEVFQHKYFSAFPGIPFHHQWVKDQLKYSGQITTLFGRRRFFFGRSNDDSTIREAIAYAPQSMTAHEIDMAYLQLWRSKLPVQLLNQVHDSINFQIPYDGHEEILPLALESMKVYHELPDGRVFTVPLEAKTGYNWGDRVDDPKTGVAKSNPNGLVKWKGGADQRKPPTYQPPIRKKGKSIKKLLK